MAELREVHLGEWERGEFRRRAAIRDPQWLQFAESGRWDMVPGSEGDGPFRHRVSTAVDAVIERHRGRTVAVVCHGGVINAYIANMYGLDRSFFVTVENTSVTVVRAGEAQRRILVVANDCHHLYDPVLNDPVVTPATR